MNSADTSEFYYLEWEVWREGTGQGTQIRGGANINMHPYVKLFILLYMHFFEKILHQKIEQQILNELHKCHYLITPLIYYKHYFFSKDQTDIVENISIC